MPLARPFAEWPLLLCGPMLRRVTRQSVAVFVATSKSCQAILEVYRGTSQSRTGTIQQSARRDTITLGKSLHVSVIEATNLSLQPGILYGYDVRLTPKDGSGREQRLADLGLLAQPLSLAYDLRLPTFSVPANLSELTIAYASCRKAHGEGPDALPLVDRMIEPDRLQPGRRPHLLILGGDQIYADDVAVPLLAMLREVANELFGPNLVETIPRTAGAPVMFSADAVAPGPERAYFANFVAALTAGMQSYELVDAHLLFLAEFYAMYLFQWSDALWPQGAVLGTSAPDLPTPQEVIAAIGPMMPTSYVGRIKPQLTALRMFARSLHPVRRTLANVPTLMIFDDHEVSDDWNINRAWNEQIRSNPSLRRVVRNGVAAYTVFQDWGNNPRKYRSIVPETPGIAERVLVTLGTDPPQTSIQPVDLDEAFDLSGTSTIRSNRMRWDWLFADPAAGYQVIGLDTRSWRALPPAPAPQKADAGLIATDPALTDAQLTAPNGPPLGFQLVAHRPSDSWLTFVVSATPILGNPIVELGLRAITTQTVDPWRREGFDNEAWSANRIVFEDMLRRLAGFGRVIILSGDVHYGFTVQGAWWDTPAGGAPRGARIVQLCSSALRNQSKLTLGVARAGWGSGGSNQLGWFGFHTARPASRAAISTGLTVFGEPIAGQLRRSLSERFEAPCVLPDRNYSGTAALEIRRLIGAVPASTERTDWRYLLDYIVDARSDGDRLQAVGLNPNLLASTPHLRDALLDTAVVGTNNVGRVRLKVLPTYGLVGVVHELHWWLSADPSGPVPMITRHEATLKPPDLATEMPEPRP